MIRLASISINHSIEGMCYEQKLDFSRRVVSVKKVEDGLKMAHINKILKNKHWKQKQG